MDCPHWNSLKQNYDDERMEITSWNSSRVENHMPSHSTNEDSLYVFQVLKEKENFRNNAISLRTGPKCLRCVFNSEQGTWQLIFSKKTLYALTTLGQCVIWLVLKHFSSNYGRVKSKYNMDNVFVQINTATIYVTSSPTPFDEFSFCELSELITTICGGETRVPDNVKHLCSFLNNVHWRYYSGFVTLHPCLWSNEKTNRIFSSLGNAIDRGSICSTDLKHKLKDIAIKSLPGCANWRALLDESLYLNQLPYFRACLKKIDKKQSKYAEEKKLDHIMGGEKLFDTSVGVFRFVRNLCIHKDEGGSLSEKIIVVNDVFKDFICRVATLLYRSEDDELIRFIKD